MATAEKKYRLILLGLVIVGLISTYKLTAHHQELSEELKKELIESKKSNDRLISSNERLMSKMADISDTVDKAMPMVGNASQILHSMSKSGYDPEKIDEMLKILSQINSRLIDVRGQANIEVPVPEVSGTGTGTTSPKQK